MKIIKILLKPFLFILSFVLNLLVEILFGGNDYYGGPGSNVDM
jgi:hypothetical protein